MINKALTPMRTFCLTAAVMSGSVAVTPQVAANTEQAVYSVVATWINDHDYILPYRKDALPFILEQGGEWTHLYFPDTLHQKGYDLKDLPDELHVMRFNSIEHMQKIFSAPEYTEPADAYFDKAFEKTFSFPAIGEDSTRGQNGNYENYFVTGMIDVKGSTSPEDFSTTFQKMAAEKGLKDSANMQAMLPPEADKPDMIFVASFASKDAYETFMKEVGKKYLENNTDRYALIGGYDTKKAAKKFEERELLEKKVASARVPLWRP